MVDAARVRARRWRPADCEMPFEEVCVQGRRVVVGRGIVGEFGGFFDCGGLVRKRG
jgi:hypothetical protein